MGPVRTSVTVAPVRHGRRKAVPGGEERGQDSVRQANGRAQAGESADLHGQEYAGERHRRPCAKVFERGRERASGEEEPGRADAPQGPTARRARLVARARTMGGSRVSGACERSQSSGARRRRPRLTSSERSDREVEAAGHGEQGRSAGPVGTQASGSLGEALTSCTVLGPRQLVVGARRRKIGDQNHWQVASSSFLVRPVTRTRTRRIVQDSD